MANLVAAFQAGLADGVIVFSHPEASWNATGKAYARASFSATKGAYSMHAIEDARQGKQIHIRAEQASAVGYVRETAAEVKRGADPAMFTRPRNHRLGKREWASFCRVQLSQS